MVVFCPGCGAKISVEPTSPGGDVQCPRCHSRFPRAGNKPAGDAPPPKRFRPKKVGGGKLAGVAIGLSALILLAGGIAAALYFTGVLGHWSAGPGGAPSGGPGGAASQPTWQEYANAEGRFRVLFPGTPTREVVTPSGRPKANARPLAVSFTVETPDATYAVAYEDLDAKTGSAEQLIEKHRGEAASGRAGKLTGEKDVTVGPHKGKELTIQLANGGTAHIRYVPAGGRLYKLTVLGTRQPPDAANVAKFFDSFEVTG